MTLTFTVYGEPAPKGSRKHYVNRHTGRVASVNDNPRTKPWEQAVALAAKQALPADMRGCRLAGATAVDVQFFLPLPKSPKLRRERSGQPHTEKPDVDKLERALLDGLGKSILADDKQIWMVTKYKQYVRDGQQPCAVVTVRTDDEAL